MKRPCGKTCHWDIVAAKTLEDLSQCMQLCGGTSPDQLARSLRDRRIPSEHLPGSDLLTTTSQLDLSCVAHVTRLQT